MINISLRQMRYFIAVAEAGRINLAAQQVNISPSAITESLKLLEQELAVILFERHQRGVRLTYDGHRFLDHCKSVMTMMLDVDYSFRQQKRLMFESLKIGASAAVMGYFLPMPLVRLSRVYPQLEIDVTEHDREKIEHMIVNGDLDLAVMLTSNMELSSGLEIESLFESKRTLCCSSHHRFAGMDGVTLADICQEPYIQLCMDETDKNTEAIWTGYGNKPKKIFRTESIEAVRSFVASGQYVTILSQLLFRSWSLEGGRLMSKDISDHVPSMSLGLVWSSEREITPSMQAVIDFLKMECKHNRFRGETVSYA
ncbi:LysR family transcriptional regulator [Dasania sp. GY-MA-18]|uniref:LysR family transcriptional regulator n=1 Tax=Dasania phycosphaerae TaxID=2950436 RepID=A0A9J6RP76_9GAMM|nr:MULTISPECIES: LysR family transcriptional regulator [Dasania]MCR8923493.1 LysR family transcriptional regulator [Dasania sp. GY-MA-18]MCZ0865927.1 LysR family transcriptional regulator [Dasania phycosphaerae]MCZ0869651.1 LysR family transcriptional regulator [Dasania phycosphaerae]